MRQITRLKLFCTAGVLCLLLLALSGCAGSTAEIEAATTPEAELDVPAEVAAAREAALNFLRRGANECVPREKAPWRLSLDERRTVDGFDIYNFTSGDCTTTVVYQLPATAETAYYVLIGDSETGFCWQAIVDAGGHVDMTGVEAATEPGPSNPASTTCEQQGYVYEIRQLENGSKCGACVFPDGTSCKAWDFFLGRCTPGDAVASGG